MLLWVDERFEEDHQNIQQDMWQPREVAVERLGFANFSSAVLR